MENKLFSKFNIYDQFGYLMVGSIGLIVMALDLYMLKMTNYLPLFNTQTFFCWFIGSYFMGHVFQSISNIKIFKFDTDDNRSNFLESEKEILTQAKEYFAVDQQSWNELYLLCYMLATAKDITGHVQTFNAHYSLYRGWFIIFLIESVISFVLSIKYRFQFNFILLLIISICLTYLFYRRSNKFYKYSRAKTLQTFILVKKLNI